MRHDDQPTRWQLDRRTFVGAVLLSCASPVSLVHSSSSFRPPPHDTARRGADSVVAFHNEMLYIDYTGQAQPYLPPRGLRSAQPLAALDAAMQCCHVYQV